MQEDPRYDDVVAEVRAFLAERIEAAVAAGIGRDRLCIDPGSGSARTSSTTSRSFDRSARSASSARLCSPERRANGSSASCRASRTPATGGTAPSPRRCGARRRAWTPSVSTTSPRRSRRSGSRTRSREGDRDGEDASCCSSTTRADERPVEEFVPLLESRFRVLTPGPPGDRSAALDAVREALGGERCGVIGHGTGGSLAQVLAAAGGVDAMVLLDAPRAPAADDGILASFDARCSCSGERTTPWCRCRWRRR